MLLCVDASIGPLSHKLIQSSCPFKTQWRGGWFNPYFCPMAISQRISENGFWSHSWESRSGLSHTPLLKKHSEFDKDSCLFEAWIHFNATDECLQIFDKIGLLLKCMNIWSTTKLHKAIKPFYWDLIFYPTYCSISITLCCWFRVVFGIMKFDFVFMYILEENMW